MKTIGELVVIVALCIATSMIMRAIWPGKLDDFTYWWTTGYCFACGVIGRVVLRQ
jgi:hypothetical protein